MNNFNNLATIELTNINGGGVAATAAALGVTVEFFEAYILGKLLDKSIDGVRAAYESMKKYSCTPLPTFSTFQQIITRGGYVAMPY